MLLVQTMTATITTFDSREVRALDPVLRTYFDLADERLAEAALAQLIDEDALPVIRRIVRIRFRTVGPAGDAREAGDADDICSDIILQLLRKLRRAREAGDFEPIASFRGYVATAAYRGCDAYLRERHPERYRLRGRVQYLLGHQPSFFVRRDDHDQWICGLAEWNSAVTRDCTPRLSELQSRSHEWVSGEGDPLSAARLAASLRAIFRFTAGPVRLEALVSTLLSVTEQRQQEQLFDDVADPAADIGETLDQQSYLRRLWCEITQLPRAQRVALLFNLRNAGGEELVSLFPLIGIATISQIADAIELSHEQFATIWNELPWEDLRIADFLGLTRQQVINLRKSARERLTRRMRVRL
jgi:DNA-directed RNA polymerase specialized sigma24 family protein